MVVAIGKGYFQSFHKGFRLSIAQFLDEVGYEKVLLTSPDRRIVGHEISCEPFANFFIGNPKKIVAGLIVI